MLEERGRIAVSVNDQAPLIVLHPREIAPLEMWAGSCLSCTFLDRGRRKSFQGHTIKNWLGQSYEKILLVHRSWWLLIAITLNINSLDPVGSIGCLTLDSIYWNWWLHLQKIQYSYHIESLLSNQNINAPNDLSEAWLGWYMVQQHQLCST